MSATNPASVTRLASSLPSGYSRPMQPRPVINVEEFIGKTGGRRVPPSGAGLQKTLNQVMAGQKRGICPRGVYRFKSHEEADAWMTHMMNRNLPESA
jgi:hypothetical protein